MKTADGTVDGAGTVIGDAAADYRNSSGYVLSGPGVPHGLQRRDRRGDRHDRLHPAARQRRRVGRHLRQPGRPVPRRASRTSTAQHPSVVVEPRLLHADRHRRVRLRRHVADEALDVRLRRRRAASTAGMGNHNLAVADVDGDQKDEIVFGSHDHRRQRQGAVHDRPRPRRRAARLATSTRRGPASRCSRRTRTWRRRGNQRRHVPGRRHGQGPVVDRGHAGHRPGGRGGHRPAATSAPRAGRSAATPRGTRRSASSGRPRASCCRRRSRRPTSSPGGTATCCGRSATTTTARRSRPACRPSPSGTGRPRRPTRSTGRPGRSRTTRTKGNPTLQADLFGDWREEIVTRLDDSSALRIATTVDLTDHRLRTLQSDPVYRLGVAWQNTALQPAAAHVATTWARG